MAKKLFSVLAVVVGIFWLSGCVENEITLPDRGHSSWADQTNIEENVDTSDLEDEEVQTVSEEEMTISEEGAGQKIKRMSFPLSEYARLPRTGQGTVKGKIYLSGAYQNRVLGKGTRLYLNPVTSYSKQWYTESYLGGKVMDDADPRLFNYLRFTASDTQGNYSFYGVPSGRYYLIGTVECGEECGYQSTKNIRIASEVSVIGGQVVQKDLTRGAE